MELLLPFVLLIFASFFQGSFGLGMKYMSPLSWEAWWLIHVTIAMIIFPFLWAIIVVPNLFDIISSNGPADNAPNIVAGAITFSSISAVTEISVLPFSLLIIEKPFSYASSTI